MQPYQRATEEVKRQGELPLKLAKQGVTVASSVAAPLAAAGAATKVLALTNRFVPQDLAIKGLSKIDPRYGNFINKAISAGKSFDEVREFISGKAEEGLSSTQAANSRNVIEQYSPELHQFISSEIQKGKSPLEAGALAQLQDPFKKIIKKLSEDHKTPFSSILQTAYPGTEKAQSSSKNSPKPGGIVEMVTQDRMMTQGNSQQGQSGQGQAALMQILQKIQQARGA
jgi:hypothetical protein